MKYDPEVLVKVYKLVDPDDEDEVSKYIGITIQSLHIRLTHHCSKYETQVNTHKANWIKSLLKQGKKPVIILLEEIIGWKNACEREMYWIQYCKENGISLTNGTLGGDGTLGSILTDEHKAAISKAQSGKIVSDETRKKLSDINIGKSGYKHSEESKEKMRKPRSPEAIKNLIAAKTGEKNPWYGIKGELAPHFGFKHSDEVRAKIKAARAKQIMVFPNVICPHCGKEGGICAMKRWHFDNCKFKK